MTKQQDMERTTMQNKAATMEKWSMWFAFHNMASVCIHPYRPTCKAVPIAWGSWLVGLDQKLTKGLEGVHSPDLLLKQWHLNDVKVFVQLVKLVQVFFLHTHPRRQQLGRAHCCF